MTDDADAIAVVGMAIRAPGARDRHEFWTNMVSGLESLTRLPEPAPAVGGGVWVPVKGCLDGADEFDADFFGYSPREAELTDPQHRMFLELAWHALEDAGHRPDSCGQVGVFASATQSQYARLHSSAGGVDELQARIATDSDFLATRVAYKLDLRGPAMTVQTACSSSLVAVHMAVNSLLSGDCDTAIAGGVTITLPLRGGYWHQTGSILSPDGHCRAFDATAAGTVPGNGAGAVVLRRLDDAMADGDDIYAVILGSALTNDGADKVGFTAPSGNGQYAAIQRALSVAGVAPDEIGMIEAHGTGTALGDPIEVGALRRVFGPERADGSRCGLSATKSNIGHLDAAAGIAGLIKAVLAVHAGVIPPVAGFTAPNPELKLDESPLQVVRRACDWPTPGRRIAGVSAFGVGGTNAHVVIGEAPSRPAPPRTTGPVTVTMSARSEPALAAQAGALADHLQSHPDIDLGDIAFTLATGRVSMPVSRSITASSHDELIAGLRSGRESAPSGQAAAPPPGRVRIHLPGYPFQRRRYWLGEEVEQTVALSPADSAVVPPGNGWLAEVFGEILGTATVDERENFFDLGGDSLMAIQLLSRVEAICGVEPEYEQFFDDPTVAGLAAQVEAAKSVDAHGAS
jgi:phthiocerol/phenolphthiocerol synthesis type-I polyketide synthase E